MRRPERLASFHDLTEFECEHASLDNMRMWILMKDVKKSFQAHLKK